MTSLSERGRNLLLVQGNLLAAHALGIRNVFVCMGGPTAIGDYPGARATPTSRPAASSRSSRRRSNHGNFALTQPVYSPEVVSRVRAAYEQRYGELRRPLLVGVLPSCRRATRRSCTTRCRGSSIPEVVHKRLRLAGEGAAKEGVEIADGIAEALAAEAVGHR